MGKQHALQDSESEPEESVKGADMNVRSMRSEDLGRIGDNVGGGGLFGLVTVLAYT